MTDPTYASGAPRAVLLDVDGTLVDSAYLHVEAWTRAFLDVGEVVPAWRTHRCIGMDGDLLVAELLGPGHPRADDAAERHGQHYRARVDLLRPLPGARELVAALDERGLVVVLATSAPEDELAHLRDVLEVEDRLDLVTSAADLGDEDVAKPAPDLVQVALDRAGVAPGEAVLVGDAVWDVAAALRAGVDAVGVLSGGVGDAELRDAGAVEVWDGPGALLAGLDRSRLLRPRMR